MGFRRGSIGAILMKDLYQLKKDREVLIEELKHYHLTDEKELIFLIRNIATYNAVIDELERIINIAELYKSAK